jgi:hypothetical protein
MIGENPFARSLQFYEIHTSPWHEHKAVGDASASRILNLDAYAANALDPLAQMRLYR